MFTAALTLLVRITWLCSNHEGRIMHGRIMFQKPGSIHCTEIGCKSLPSKCRTDSPLNWKRLSNRPNQHFYIYSLIPSYNRIRQDKIILKSIDRKCKLGAGCLMGYGNKISLLSLAMTSPDHLAIKRPPPISPRVAYCITCPQALYVFVFTKRIYEGYE